MTLPATGSDPEGDLEAIPDLFHLFFFFRSLSSFFGPFKIIFVALNHLKIIFVLLKSFKIIFVILKSFKIIFCHFLVINLSVWPFFNPYFHFPPPFSGLRGSVEDPASSQTLPGLSRFFFFLGTIHRFY